MIHFLCMRYTNELSNIVGRRTIAVPPAPTFSIPDARKHRNIADRMHRRIAGRNYLQE